MLTSYRRNPRASLGAGTLAAMDFGAPGGVAPLVLLAGRLTTAGCSRRIPSSGGRRGRGRGSFRRRHVSHTHSTHAIAHHLPPRRFAFQQITLCPPDVAPVLPAQFHAGAAGREAPRELHVCCVAPATMLWGPTGHRCAEDSPPSLVICAPQPSDIILAVCLLSSQAGWECNGRADAIKNSTRSAVDEGRPR